LNYHDISGQTARRVDEGVFVIFWIDSQNSLDDQTSFQTVLNLLRKVVRLKLVSVVSGLVVLVLGVSGLLVMGLAAILVSSSVVHANNNRARNIGNI
jgi:hypothetical protein